LLQKNNNRIITLLTDFGIQDPYVAEIKGTILSVNFDAKIVDISHQISSYDIREAAFLIGMYYNIFAKKTIHLAVVDPGVGGERENIIVKTKNFYFVGPDNGIFSMIFQKEKNFTIYKINYSPKNKYSNTFFGRDYFAPIAAMLSKGDRISKIGKKTDKFIKLDIPKPDIDENMVIGQIMYVDGFGNLITNIYKDIIKTNEKKLAIRVGDVVIDKIGRTFSSVSPGEPVAYIGSHGYLEIAINKGTADKSLGTVKGSNVELLYY